MGRARGIAVREALRRVLYERPLVVTGVVMAVHLAVMALMFDPAPHAGGDNTAYLALARALLDFGQYIELWDPARPPHTQYPPGFPGTLAVAWLLGLRSWAALKMMMVGFSAVAVGLSHLWLRNRVAPVTALVLAGLLAVSPGLAAEGQWVLSDVPFWAATMAVLLALARGRTGWGIGLALAALAIRTAGLPLLLAIAVWLAVRRRWKAALGLLAVLVAVGTIWALRTPSMEAPYVSQFWLVNPYAPEAGTIGPLALVERVLENAERYGLRIVTRSLTGSTGLFAGVVGAMLVAFAAIGLVRRLRPGGVPVAPAAPGRHRDRSGRKGPGVAELFFVLYSGMILIWPAQWASDRFLLPLLPLLLAYAAEGTAILPDRYRQAVRVVGVGLLVGLSAPPAISLRATALACRAEVREVGATGCRPPGQQAFLDLAEWTRGRLPDGAVVLSRKPRQWYWFSGYPSRIYPFSPEPDRLLEAAREARARYVVLDMLGATSEVYLTPAVVASRHRFCLVQRIQRGREAASLLGVLPVPRQPPALDEPGDGAGLTLPVCPPAYRSAD